MHLFYLFISPYPGSVTSATPLYKEENNAHTYVPKQKFLQSADAGVSDSVCGTKLFFFFPFE